MHEMLVKSFLTIALAVLIVPTASAHTNIECKNGAALLDGQRAWPGYRDTACIHIVANDSARTLDRLLAQMCYVDLISQRADRLDEIGKYYHEFSNG